MTYIWMMDNKSCDKLYWCRYEGKHSNYKGRVLFSQNQNLVYVIFYSEKNIFFEKKCKVKPPKFNA